MSRDQITHANADSLTEVEVGVMSALRSKRNSTLATAVTFPDRRTEAEVIAAINAEQARRIALAFG